MVFSSLVFLLRFFTNNSAALLLLYRGQSEECSADSSIAVFYAWGEPVWVILLIISSVVDYICGGLAGKASQYA